MVSFPHQCRAALPHWWQVRPDELCTCEELLVVNFSRALFGLTRRPFKPNRQHILGCLRGNSHSGATGVLARPAGRDARTSTSRPGG